MICLRVCMCAWDVITVVVNSNTYAHCLVLVGRVFAEEGGWCGGDGKYLEWEGR